MTDGGSLLPPRRVRPTAPIERPTSASGPPGRSLPERRHRAARTEQGVLSPFAIVPVVILTLIYAVYLLSSSGDYLSRQMPVSAAFLVPLSVIVVYVLIRRVSAEETRFDLRTIMLTGFVLRLVGTYFRWYDPADSLEYHQVGIGLAERFRAFDLWPETGRPIPGTGWLRYVTGVVQVFTFDDVIATFIVFATIAFIGAFLCYRAFTHAVPDGHHRKYALLVFLWPSLCYWPSSIGKESWMILAIGVTSWGVARFYTDQPWVGLPVMGLGLTMVSILRPHVALMLLVGFATALLARGTERHSTSRFLFRILAVALVLVGGSLVAARAADILKVDSTGTENISVALDQASVQTSQGTGQFDAALVRTPLDYPGAFVTVWFRPFPWEARSGVTQMLSAAENLVLLVILAMSWRQLRNLPRALLRLPYVTYAVSYLLAFVFGFAAIGNFGILARQRTQGLMLLFVLLCVPEIHARGAAAGFRARAARDDDSASVAEDAALDPASASATATSARTPVLTGARSDDWTDDHERADRYPTRQSRL